LITLLLAIKDPFNAVMRILLILIGSPAVSQLFAFSLATRVQWLWRSRHLQPQQDASKLWSSVASAMVWSIRTFSGPLANVSRPKNFTVRLSCAFFSSSVRVSYQWSVPVDTCPTIAPGQLSSKVNLIGPWKKVKPRAAIKCGSALFTVIAIDGGPADQLAWDDRDGHCS
jgi:hypothetical protein